MFEVYITKAAKYLPNEPVSNEEMEDYLGKINEVASKARRLILRNNGIKTRYYALNKDGKPTHTNADLTNNAIEALFDESFSRKDTELLSCGTSTPDNLLPSHAAMVHGLMKNHSVELNSSSGVCCAGMNALKFGFLSVKSGSTANAICTGSERVSTWMLADKFENEVENLKTLEEQPVIAFKKDFLRWMLSDGAGSLLLENKPSGEISLRIEWMEAYSYAHELESCMYAGGDKMENGELKPWSDFAPNEWAKQSVFSLKQDVKTLDKHILDKGSDCIRISLEKHQVDPSEVDHFLPHVSSNYFVAPFYEAMIQRGMTFPKEKWFMNLSRVGNVGSASIYLMVEELMNSGKLKKGEKILLIVPESGRFSYAHAYLTVC
ncbi:beta-ketoacyl-ACP synthase III [Flavobacterium sp. GT3R68]|uniref:beta-ketoacyl-ACP synthase III n=1 Tax=Flavobacterium sp. GT3R68 TaxID=2594437 RepID=UPI000F87552B|nr:beta-ketoacyl-ACP synthase III [Flavobacterium sp. GT3R68]RTY94012.1 StlD/DarB family beta-ketosynthase [Flavobacterium sp. GSN2]TRW94167.1 StlD/DarB family beta-ketosynthase [Flavobacterium sp. GT3R68]